MDARDHVLAVDDVLGCDYRIAALGAIGAIEQAASLNVACAYFNAGHNKVGFVADYPLPDRKIWLLFRHQLQALSEHKLAAEKPGLGQI